METDTVCLLEVAMSTLAQVTEGTMNETLLQDSLSLWRQGLTRYLIELPSIQTTLNDFDNFLKSCGITGDPQSRMDTLRQRIETSIRQTEKVYASLRSEISIIESRRGIAEAESISKLTELAFIFIPISFAASIFGMQVREFQVPPPIYAFVVAALVALGISYSVRLSIRSDLFLKRKDALFHATRQHARIATNGPIPARSLVRYLVRGFWHEQWARWCDRQMRMLGQRNMQYESRWPRQTGDNDQIAETLSSEDMP